MANLSKEMLSESLGGEEKGEIVFSKTISFENRFMSP